MRLVLFLMAALSMLLVAVALGFKATASARDPLTVKCPVCAENHSAYLPQVVWALDSPKFSGYLKCARCGADCSARFHQLKVVKEEVRRRDAAEQLKEKAIHFNQALENERKRTY